MARQTLSKEEINNYKIDILKAAKKIIEEKGYEKTTAKELSKMSFLNIAYLYKFFDNIDEIKLYCAIIDLKKYIDELISKKIFFIDMPALDKYYAIWEIFLKHAFTYRESFKYLYFSEHADRLPTIVKDYFSLFPQDFEGFPANMQDVLMAPDINYRTDLALYPALEGKLPKEDIALISKISEKYVRSLLFETDSQDEDVIKKQIADAMQMLHFLNKPYEQ